MSNEEIINSRWKNTDKILKHYLKDLKKIKTNTLDDVIDVFNSLDITYKDLNKPISKAEKRKLDKKIKEWKKQGLLVGYFAYLVSSKKVYTYSDLIEILLYGIYSNEEKEVNELSKTIFTEVANDIYIQATEESPVKPKKSFSLTWAYIWSLLCIPSYNKTWDEYLKLLTLTNQQELYKQVIGMIQQNKQIKEEDLQTLIKKQTNRILSINDDKYSGVLSDTCRVLGNQVYIEPFKEEKQLQVRFIAEIDDRTTKMCKSMDNMLFFVNDINKFYRYSDYDKKEVLYTVKGLELGVNLPPINNHFHWCRSTIIYNVDLSYQQMYNITNQDAFVERIKPSEFDKKIVEYEDKIRNESVENMYVIQPNGNVYHFVGTDGNVKATDVDLEDAIVTHNHPRNVTQHSLSSLDRIDFNNNKIARYRGVDYKYIYEINRDINFKEEMPNMEPNYSDDPKGFHLDNILYSYRNNIGYKRWKNDR